MGKVLIVFDELEQVAIQRICLDKDPNEALQFVLQVIEPKLHRRVPCMEKSLDMRLTRGTSS
ncbi:MAG: hypothetical protein Q8P31_12660 [Bacillota bacterium]|nr:hypothetical protein [Bacillota bacterium]